MIITIRKQFQQSAFRYVALFIVVVLAAGMISIPTLMRYEGGSTWAINVNDEKIAYQEFAREIAEQSEFIAHIRAQYGQYADLLMQAMHWPTDPRTLAFDLLVKTTLLNQCATDLGIYISPYFIAQNINDAQFARRYLQKNVPAFLFDPSGSLNEEKLALFLKHKGMSIRDFESNIERALTQQQLFQFVNNAAYTPWFDIEQAFIAHHLGKEFSYLEFSLDSFLASEKKQTISDEDALNFYTKENSVHRRYWVSEKRDGIIWKFNAKNYGNLVSEQEINEYYEDHKVNKYVLDPIKVHVQQITEKSLPSDMTLEMVKEEIEQNPSSPWSKKWEALAPFGREDKKGSFDQAAFLLQNAGDISSVIETKDGKVIIQLVKRIPRTYKPLASVRNEIKSLLIEKQFKKSFIKDVQVITKAHNTEEIDSFIAQKSGKKEMVSGTIKNDTMLAQELFRLKKGEYAFFMENETGVIVLLTDVIGRHLPDYNSIKEIVKADIIQERAQKKMMDTIEEAKIASKRDSFDILAKQFHVPLHHTGMILRQDNKKMQELDKKGLPIRSMMESDKVGVVFVHNNDERVNFLIKVDAFEQYDKNNILAVQKELKKHLIPSRMKEHAESFVASLHRNATIETNESILIAGEEYSE